MYNSASKQQSNHIWSWRMTIYLKKKTPLPLSSLTNQQQAEEEPITVADLCHCEPLSSLHMNRRRESMQEEEEEQLVLAAPELNSRLRMHVQDLLSHIDTLSIILLHVAQIEPPPIVPPSLLPPRRQHYHVTDSFMEQVMVNVRRVIREDDTILLQPGSGAVLLLPGVDAQGTYHILERIHRSLDLLQAETVIPPLTRETTILLGSGSYPEQGNTVEQLLYATGTVLRQVTLRPTHVARRRNAPSLSLVREQKMSGSMYSTNSSYTVQRQLAPISPPAPFMHLPAELPRRLKQLIPYHLAQKLSCVPVGRDHQCLTVALANPANREAVHCLEERTGMTIFPVSCDEEALLTLLKKPW
jgi:hypothetical protein